MKSKMLIMLLFAAQMNAAAVETVARVDVTTKVLHERALIITPAGCMVPGDLKGATIFHAGEDFNILKDGAIYPVHRYNLSKELRCLTDAEVQDMMMQGDYLKLTQSSNGDYNIELMARLNGGGLLGAKIGSWIGKVGVYAIGYGTISLISAATGPLAKGTFVTLTKFLAGPIEATSNAAAIGMGIYLGVQTGPV